MRTKLTEDVHQPFSTNKREIEWMNLEDGQSANHLMGLADRGFGRNNMCPALRGCKFFTFNEPPS